MAVRRPWRDQKEYEDEGIEVTQRFQRLLSKHASKPRHPILLEKMKKT
jgi:hypothetical protein